MTGISQFSQLKLGFNLAIFVSKDSDNVILFGQQEINCLKGQ